MAVSPVPALPFVNAVNVNTPIFESWTYTQIKIEKFSFTWTIENFSLLNVETGQFLQSPEFSVGANDEYKWRLQIYPKGYTTAYKEFLSVFLHLQSCPKSTAQCKIKFAILNAENEQIFSQCSGEALQFEVCEGYGFGNFIKRDLVLNESSRYRFLPEDTLTILCEGIIVTDRVNSSSQDYRSKITVPDCKLSEDFKNLIINENFSDVILEVDGHEIKAHKAILSARSEVFAAMFKHNLTENQSNRVTITDINYEVLKEMLCFIYTGTAPNLEKIAKDLYAAADKYALKRLKVTCEIVLLENLSVETAAETLILAYLHSSVQMKAEAIHFFKSHITEITKTKGWLNIMTSYPNLEMEIIESLLKKSNNALFSNLHKQCP